MRVADPDQQAEQRERILDAAIKAFARHGFHKASMTDIAAAAEMSAGNLYRYFTSKESIIRSLAERERREALTTLDGLAQAPDIVDGLVALAVGASSAANADKAVVDLEITAEMARNPELAALFAGLEQEALDRLAKAIAAAKRKAQVAAGIDPKAAARLLMALYYILPSSEMLSKAEDRDVLLSEMRRLIKNYLRPPARRR